ncbi:MAG: hypothetical protein CBB92_00390 [Flammeovirgaceae bacterium TMED32]|nr:MAG: hypothetical protein CBB92_00390 [Flammeovirgaceae bacterium TMED32]
MTNVTWIPRENTPEADSRVADLKQAPARVVPTAKPDPAPKAVQRAPAAEKAAAPAPPSPSAPAQEAVADSRYVALFCSAGTIDRTISVEYDNTDRPLPCRVRYHKPTEGKTEYPWRAANSVGYCEQKADGLVEQLRGYGWRCSPLGYVR